MLVRIVKNWDSPDLMRQTPGGLGVWDGVNFSLGEDEECDFLIILNDLRNELEVCCPRDNIWAVFQEPYVPGFNPWMRYGHQQYRRIYTCCPPGADSRYKSSQPMVPWHVSKSYDELKGAELPDKNDQISWVTSNLVALPGHRLRHDFYRYAQKLQWPELKVWGRGIHPVDDKWEVLAPSKYALAVENYAGVHYWTEKVADCWLAYSLPFYYGCLNLEDYFPAESFIRIDLSDFSKAVDLIRSSCEQGEYEKRLPAICEARRLVLEKRQFFPTIVSKLKSAHSGKQCGDIVKIKPFTLSAPNILKEKVHRWMIDFQR